MGLVDDKKKVFDTISAYSSFMEQTKSVKTGKVYSSINNSNDITSYLLDLLKTVAGTDGLKQLIGGLFTNLITSSESQFKQVLIKQFTQSNSTDNISTHFSTVSGITLNAKDIDIKGKLKINPYSDAGKLIYDHVNENFDSVAYNAILNSGSQQNITDLNMSILYNENTDTFTIKPLNNTTIGNYFTNYINNAQIFNTNEIVTNIMDTIYGTFSNKNNKTSDQILEDLQVQKMLSQLLNGDDSFTISPDDYNTLLKNSIDLAASTTYYNMGCGLMPAILSFPDLNNLINTISGSTDSHAVSNAIEGTIDNSTTGNTGTTNANKQTIKDGFFQKLILIFIEILLQALTQSPQIRVLLAVMSSLLNNGLIKIGNPLKDMKDFKIFIKCLAKEVLSIVSEYIFNIIVGYIIAILEPVTKKILTEKINQYTNIIKSLLPASKLPQITI